MTGTNDRKVTNPIVLRAANHRKMPWKNGQGFTTEIAVFPPDAGLTDFAWRVSMATVATDGAFSTFADIDRTLAILRGDGLQLSVNGAMPARLTIASQPFSFPADVSTDATLIGGDVIDLNVMTRRDQWRHRVTRMTSEQTAETPQSTSDVSIWFCVQGAATLRNAENDDSAPAVQVQENDAIVFRAPSALPVPELDNSETELILIEFEQLAD